LAFFLSEALKSSFIKHEIVGYHAPVNHRLKELDKNPIYNRNSNSLDTVIYNSFNSNNNEGLANLKFQATDNSDGESLRLVGKRLLRERSKRKILFLITDGKPFLTDSNIAVLDQDLKDSISYLKSNKVEIIAIGFNDQGKLFYGDDYLKVLNNSDLFNFCLRKL
jgi:cobalamin biosynthesis protein CobT